VARDSGRRLSRGAHANGRRGARLRRRLRGDPAQRERDEIRPRAAKDTLVQISLRATQLATRSEADAQRLAAEKRTLEAHYARDALTGVFARGHLDASLARAYDDAIQFDRPLSLLFCDIDHFKKVNDTHGHAVGDRVLAAVAAAIGAATRQLDIVGRYGGEEFVVILPATTAEGASVVAERVRERVEALVLVPTRANRSS
jgi:diguanylate cyclase (GGDEF)-like protein